MRLKAKVDSNQKVIVKALRKVGAVVFCAHQIGKGFPDLVVGYNKKTSLLEVKIPGGKLTPDQVEFIKSWEGEKVFVVESPIQALQAIGVEFAEA